MPKKIPKTEKPPDFAPWHSIVPLDEGSSEPYYQQIVRHLRVWFAEKSSDQPINLPSERDFAESLGLSRRTVRRAYEMLQAEDLLTRHGRGGTQARAPERIMPKLGKLKGFTQEMQEVGLIPSTRLVHFEITKSAKMAEIFGKNPENLFLNIIRVRCANDVPMTREVAWYDAEAVPALQHWDGLGSAYDFIAQNSDLVLNGAQQTIEAMIGGDLENQVFSFEKPTACLLLTRKTYAQRTKNITEKILNKILIEYVEGIFRGDLYTYKLALGDV